MYLMKCASLKGMLVVDYLSAPFMISLLLSSLLHTVHSLFGCLAAVFRDLYPKHHLDAKHNHERDKHPNNYARSTIIRQSNRYIACRSERDN
eukprot:gene6667-4776_t